MKWLFMPLALLATAASAQDIRVDGSSTVYPISLAVAEEFYILNPEARITVAFSGTGGGFEKFCNGEIQVSDASRVIKEGEIRACAASGVAFIELPVAFDALTVAVNSANDFVECLTTDELARMFEPNSAVTTWSDVRPEWPDEEILFFSPGTDSGTFDYFTEAINGESGASRTDVFPSEDDNVLVQGITGNENAIGYFGYAYYLENQDRLEAVAVDGGEGCVLPSTETIENGTYTPLSRPLFIYVNAWQADANQALADFATFYLSAEARPYIADTGYVPLSEEAYRIAMDRFEQRVTGSAFMDFAPGESVTETVAEGVE